MNIFVDTDAKKFIVFLLVLNI